jgi:hypothetical protein
MRSVKATSLLSAALTFLVVLTGIQLKHAALLKAQTRFQPVALWRSDGRFTTLIDLVNWSDTPATATLLLYDSAGRVAVQHRVSLGPASTATLDAESFFGNPPIPSNTRTGLVVLQGGTRINRPDPIMGLSRIVQRTRSSRPETDAADSLRTSGAADADERPHGQITFVAPIMHVDLATRRFGLAWRPSATSSYELVLANTDDSEQQVNIYYEATAATHLTLNPRETKTINMSALVPRGQRAAQLIVDSKTPGLLVSGLVSDDATGFATRVEFMGTIQNQPTVLHGAYAPIGSQNDVLSQLSSSRRFSSTLILGNTSNRPNGVDVVLDTSVGQHQSVFHLPRLTLAPSETRVVQLPNPWDDWLQSGPIGVSVSAKHSVIAKAVSMDQAGSFTIETPLVGRSGFVATHNNPWRLRDGDSTVLFVRNPTDTIQRTSIHVHHSQGDYLLAARVIRPHETATFDLRSIRDSQIPDPDGHVIPLDADEGFFSWFALNGGNTLVGRSLVYNQTRATSVNYSCISCDSPPIFQGISADSSPNGGSTVGDESTSGNLTVTSNWSDGSHVAESAYATYSQFDSNVVTVNAADPAQVNNINSGSTNIHVDVNESQTTCQINEPAPGLEECDCNSSGVSGSADVPADTQPEGTLAVDFRYASQIGPDFPEPGVKVCTYAICPNFPSTCGTTYNDQVANATSCNAGIHATFAVEKLFGFFPVCHVLAHSDLTQSPC